MSVQQQVLMDILARRRNRAISIILGVKEKQVDQYIDKETSDKLRKVVLDQVNEFADFAADVCRSMDTGDFAINEMYLDKLDAIYNEVVENAS